MNTVIQKTRQRQPGTPPPPATQGFIKGLQGGSLWNWALNEPPASEGGVRRPRQGLVILSQREALLQEAAIVQLF